MNRDHDSSGLYNLIDEAHLLARSYSSGNFAQQGRDYRKRWALSVCRVLVHLGDELRRRLPAEDPYAFQERISRRNRENALLSNGVEPDTPPK